MAYIGRQLVRGQNRIYDDISSSFNGSTTAFNLTIGGDATPPAQVNQLWIVLGGILQKPGTDFTVADAQVTFTTAPAAGLDFWAMIQGDTSDMNAPSDGSVTPTKIATSGDFAFPADIRLKDADGSHYVGVQAPTTVSSNLVWTLPAADGSANQYLKTNGSGTLSWASDTATDATKMPLAGGTFTGDISIPDKVIHAGDTNTAIRFPAADTFSVETGGSERARVDSSGNVGIGESASIDARLHVNSGTDNTTLFIESTDGDTNLGMADNAGSCRLLQAGGNLRFRTGGNANAFGTGDGERMVLDSSGRLIVGHTADIGYGWRAQLIGTDGNTSAACLMRFSATSGGPHLALGKSRNATPGSNTIVQDDDVLGSISFRADDGTDYATAAAQIQGRVSGTPGANDMPGALFLRTTADAGSSPISRLIVDSKGRVRIGDGCESDYSISDDANAKLQLTSATTPKAIFIRNDTSVVLDNWLGIIDFHSRDGGPARGARIGAIAEGTHASNDNPTALSFQTCADGAGASTEAVRIRADGDLKINDGDLVIGTSGHGIDFSATSGPNNGSGTSELLDDYEEGTWTPSYIDAGGGITVSGYDYQQGNYTKIGNHVYIQARLRTSGVTVDSNGTYDLGGLPFTSKTTDANGLLICSMQNDWVDAPHQFTVNSNNTTARAREGISVGDSQYTNSSTNGFNETAGDKNRTYIMGSYIAA